MQTVSTKIISTKANNTNTKMINTNTKTVLSFFLFLLFLVAPVLFLTACSKTGGNESEKLPSEDKFGAYLHALYQLRDKEQAAISAYQAVSGENFKTEKALFAALDKETIPKYSSLVSNLHTISLTNKVLSNLHARYVRAAEVQLKGFRKTRDYLIHEDRNMQQQAASLLKHAQKLMRSWQQDVTGLNRKIRAKNGTQSE